METRAGAGEVLHGALSGGALASALLPSEALLPMIPSLQRISQKRLPAALHVEARGLSRDHLVSFLSNDDVYAVSAASACFPGPALLSSGSPQEVHDLAVVAHLSSIASSFPFVHFFDGVRVAEETSPVSVLPFSSLFSLLDLNAVALHRERAESGNLLDQTGLPSLSSIPETVSALLESIGKLSRGEPYRLFEYIGAPDASTVLVSLASAAHNAELAVRQLQTAGKKVGLLKIRLLRPWSSRHFLSALPSSASRVAVLDVSASSQTPLYADVVASLCYGQREGKQSPFLTSVRAGGPEQAELSIASLVALFEIMSQPEKPKPSLELGHLSPETLMPALEPPMATKVLVWEKMEAQPLKERAEEALEENLETSVQTLSRNDSYSPVPARLSHLRFKKGPAVFPHSDVKEADLVICQDLSLLSHYNILANARPGSTLLLKIPETREKAESSFPPTLKRDLFNKKVSLFYLPAAELVQRAGLPTPLLSLAESIALEAAFYHLAGLSHALLHEERDQGERKRKGRPKHAQPALDGGPAGDRAASGRDSQGLGDCHPR